MKAFGFKEHGEFGVMQFFDLPAPEVDSKNNVRVKLKASAFNHLDIWVRKGWPGLKLAMPHISGSDGAGIVDEVYHSKSKLKPGDRVAVYPGIITIHDEFTEKGEHSVSPHYQILGEQRPGTHCEYITVPERNLVKIPDHIDFDTACAAGLVSVTAWRMLIHRAQIKPGEKVLVLGAGGGVNSIAIQLARFAGCEVFAITSGEEKCLKTRALGVKHVIDYRAEPDWSKKMFKLSEGRGFDVIVDNVGQATLNDSLKLVKPGGRIVVVGNTSGPHFSLDVRYLFAKQISLIGSTMGNYKDYHDVMKLVFAGHIRPIIDQVFPFDAAKEAMQRLEKGAQFGKILLRYD